MKETQKENWKNQIGQMNPRNQLELADIIIEKLEFNEKSLTMEAGYNFEMSQKLRTILEKHTKQSNSELETKRRLELLKKFLSLSKNSQTKVIEDFFENMIEVMKREEQMNCTFKCEKSGHQYSKWEKNEYTTREETSIQARLNGYGDYFDVPHTYWLRKCINCEFVEKSETEPLEFQKNREEKEKQEKILKLKKELELLEQ